MLVISVTLSLIYIRFYLLLIVLYSWLHHFIALIMLLLNLLINLPMLSQYLLSVCFF